MKKWITDNMILVALYGVLAILIIIIALTKIIPKFGEKEPEPEVAPVVIAHNENVGTDLDYNYTVGLQAILDSHKDLTYKFYQDIGEMINEYLSDLDYKGRRVELQSYSDRGLIITMIFTIEDSPERLQVEYTQGDATFNFTII